MATAGSLSTYCTNVLKESVYSCCSSCKENDRKTTAGHYCVECEMYFCTQCVKCHSTIPSLKKHQVNDVSSTDLDDVDDETTERGSESVQSLRCPLHQGKLMDTYCKDHDEVCCGICAVLKHRGCTRETIAVAAKDFKSNPEVQKSKEELTKLLLQLKQEKEKRTENLDHIDQQKVELIKNVDSYEEQIIAKVKTFADSSRKDIRSKFEELKTAIDKDVEHLDDVITNTELHVNVLKRTDDELLFGNVKISKIVITDVETLLKAMTTDWRKQDIKFNFDNTLVQGVKSFGQLENDFKFEDYVCDQAMSDYPCEIICEKPICNDVLEVESDLWIGHKSPGPWARHTISKHREKSTRWSPLIAYDNDSN